VSFILLKFVEPTWMLINRTVRHEALEVIRIFDYGGLYNADFSENFGAAIKLTIYYQSAALAADISLIDLLNYINKYVITKL